MGCPRSSGLRVPPSAGCPPAIRPSDARVPPASSSPPRLDARAPLASSRPHPPGCTRPSGRFLASIHRTNVPVRHPEAPRPRDSRVDRTTHGPHPPDGPPARLPPPSPASRRPLVLMTGQPPAAALRRVFPKMQRNPRSQERWPIIKTRSPASTSPGRGAPSRRAAPRRRLRRGSRRPGRTRPARRAGPARRRAPSL